MVLMGTDALRLNTPVRPYTSYSSDTSDSSDQGNHPLPQEEFLNLHRGTKKLFRSFISFFRSFFSCLGEGFLFSTELFGISSVIVLGNS